MMIYTLNNGKYICEGEYSFEKMKKLLQVYPPNQVVLSNESNIIKVQLDRYEET